MHTLFVVETRYDLPSSTVIILLIFICGKFLTISVLNNSTSLSFDLVVPLFGFIDLTDVLDVFVNVSIT